MAVVVEVVVARGSKAQFDEVDVVVSGAMERSGPPPGLMSHLVKPVGDGFVISDVWRTAEDFHPFNVVVLQPALAAAGLVAGDAVISSVWSFARP
jgi:hypothetical protein